jgi:hypothetical protein
VLKSTFWQKAERSKLKNCVAILTKEKMKLEICEADFQLKSEAIVRVKNKSNAMLDPPQSVSAQRGNGKSSGRADPAADRLEFHAGRQVTKRK